MAFKSLIALASLAVALPASVDDIVPGKFIVTLQPDLELDLNSHTQWVSEVHARSLERRGGETLGVEKTFDLPNFHAYYGSFDEETLEIIKANSSVLRVEPDLIVRVASTVEQENPPWGLSAISNANPPSPDSSYFYDSSAGEGTFSYIFDTGILLEHIDFEGRAVEGTKAYTGETDLFHGTLVAAIVGGATYGVAKKTTLIDVQVLGNSGGSLSTILDGIDWALNDVVSKDRVGKSVINMSLSTSNSATFNDAVQVLIDAGIPVVAASGNSFNDASTWSPANQPNVITVGASSSSYQRASFSNFGPAVDIFAPGVDILTASSASPDASVLSSGTSEASPHVAGVVAYLLGLEGPRTPAEITARVLELAIPDIIQDPQGSANLFLYNGIGE